MIRARINKKILWICNIVFSLIFVFGTILQTQNSDLFWLGVICQTISFAYTALSSYTGLISSPTYGENLSPTVYFTDRHEALAKFVKHLYSIIYEKKHEQVITIICSEIQGSGKTEFLIKLKHIFENKQVARKDLDEENYKLYRKIKKKLGYVHMIEYQGDRSISQINQLPYIIGKRNVVIVDNFSSASINKFNKKFIIVFCRGDEKKLDEPNENLIKLKNFTKDDVRKYYKSKYDENIQELHLNKIMSYSNGNISIITSILSSRNTYEIFCKNSELIFELEKELKSGDYISARNKIDSITSSQKSNLASDVDTKYRIDFIEAELLHLENKYEQALCKFEALRVIHLNNPIYQEEILGRIAHIYKHLGDFKRALSEISNLPSKISSLQSLSLNLLAYSFYEDDSFLRETKAQLRLIEDTENLCITAEKDTYHTYKAVECIYSYKYPTAHKMIDQAIDLYENKDSRFLNNCYFIKAEIYRHEKKYTLACKYYQRCLNAFRFNNDFDVYSMSFIMLTFLNTAYDINYCFDNTYSLEEVKKECADSKMEYNKKLCMSLDVLIKNNASSPKYLAMKTYFDKYVFFIP